MKELEYVQHKLYKDLSKIGIYLNSNLKIKNYSKTQWGNYNPNTDTITIYVFAEKECMTLIEYGELFKTLLHEYVHSLEWGSSNWLRLKGVMHDPLFHRMYNYLENISVKAGIINENR